MDSITKEVCEQYNQHPFPNHKGDIDCYVNAAWFKQMLDYFEEQAEPHAKSFLENKDILEVGCGTGPTIAKLAQLYPSCHALGVDISPVSIDIANNNKYQHSIDNLDYQIEDVLEMNLHKQFDVIVCVGVLHHLSDPALGLEQLKAHLKPDGYLMLWVYGSYGRYLLNLNQTMLKSLFQNVSSMEKKVSLTEYVLTQSEHANLTCHLDTPEQRSPKFYNENISHAMANKSWLVDQFLHVHEKTYTLIEIKTLLEAHQMKIDKWLGQSLEMKHYMNHSEIIDLYDHLSQDDQYRIIDLMVKPQYYMLCIKHS